MTPALERARELRLAAVADNTAGRPVRAARLLRAALRLLPPLDTPAARDVDSVRVACLLTLAASELPTSGLPGALPLLEEARRIAGDDAELLARWRCQRGMVLGRSGDLASAAEDLAVVSDQPEWFTAQERCSLLLNHGMVFLELGRPADAAVSFRASAALAREIDHQPLVFMAEHNFGFAKYLTGDLPGALAAMAAAEAMPVDVFRGPSLFDLGKVLHEAGLLDEAVAALEGAQRACRPRQDQILRAEIDLERARVLRLAGEPADAAAAARSARRRFTRIGATALAARADLTVLDCDLTRGRRLAAVLTGALADEAIAVASGDSELRARSISVAAEAASRNGRPELARTVLARYPQESFGLVVALRHAYASAVTDLASGRSPRPRLATAAAALAESQAASASLDSRAARKVLGLRLSALDLDLAVGRGPADLLSTLERWTTRGLPVIRPPADPELAAIIQELRLLAQALREEPESPQAGARRAEIARLRRQLSDRSLAQRQSEATVDPLPTLDVALSVLREADRDLLWLFPHDGALWGIAVTAGRRSVRRLIGLTACLEVSRRLQADLRAAAYQPPGPLRESIAASRSQGLDRLDEEILRPWRFRSTGLVVIGTHAVASAPWNLLPSLRGVPVTVARSVTEWAARRASRVPRIVRVLGGPGLRFAATEVRDVAASWADSEVLTEARTADLVSALAEAEVVHLAAHGQHQPASPLFSSVRLTDGDLVAHELTQTPVRAGHVVLSACEVGTAAVRPGDEPLGLASTLLELGVNSVVAAVAPVADDSTAAIMADYHARLAGGLPTDEALAAATPQGSPFVALGSTWRAAV